MNKLPAILVLLAVLASPIVTMASEQGQAENILDRYLHATGGLKEIRQVENISVTARIDAFDYEYSMHLLDDGRFCIEAPDQTTVYDGEDYWQTFHGVVQSLEGEALDGYRDISLTRVFFHNFLDDEGQMVDLAYEGQKVQRGQTYDLLTYDTADGEHQEHYLNAETGLVDKMIELVPDPDLRELKNVYTYSNYQDVGPLKVPTLFQAKCLTNGEDLQPLTQMSDFRVNENPDPSLFKKPQRSAPEVGREGDALLGQVMAFSRGRSLITNITAEDLAPLNPADGDTLIAKVQGRETRLLYMEVIEDFGVIGPGDYLATFNRTPALWLVKAYVGMATDDSTYVEGVGVHLTKSSKTN